MIGIFDSGVGGLSVWREVAHLLPDHSTLYVADQAHVPYGPRPLQEVREFAEGVTRFLLAEGAAVVVIACNTASAAALHSLRRTFPATPFVGMEPAVKPASEKTRSGRIGVIATSATFQGQLFAALLDRFANGVEVHTQACPGLVQAVEAGQLDTPATVAMLREYLQPLLDSGIDHLVLGCTHYPFLRPAIEQVVGAGVEVIDPTPAVARQVRRVLNGLPAPLPPPRHTFCTSGNPASFAALLERLVGQTADVQALSWQKDRLDRRRVSW